MRAVVTLTPTESKKLIAKAVVQTPEVVRAREKGEVAIHPSTTTYFVFEELTGAKPETEVWLCGIIAPKGLCAEWGSYMQLTRGAEYLAKPGGFPHSWVIKDGSLQPQKTIDELCQTLGPDDVYIKSGNALDPDRNVGVLIGSMAEGTIARIAAAAKKRHFPIVLAMGLEKLIPVPIKEASRALGSGKKLEYSMGLRCGLFPVSGVTVTETEAIKIISGAEAVPVAAGGVGGGEGSVVLLLSGEKKKVTKAVEAVESVKGAALPTVRTPECQTCIAASVCPMAGHPKSWC